MPNPLKDNVGIQPELSAILVQPIMASLAQTTSATYVQAEAQATATKVDAIITALRNAGIIST